MFLLYEPQYFNVRRRVAQSFISLSLVQNNGKDYTYMSVFPYVTHNYVLSYNVDKPERYHDTATLYKPYDSPTGSCGVPL